MRGLSSVVLALCALAGPVWAQGAASSPSAVRWSASVRVRAESWDWFDDGAAGEYGYAHALAKVAAARATGRWQWRLEGAIPVVAGLPNDAVQPAPRGQLGLGASYYATNDNKTTAGSAFIKQAFVRWGQGGRSVRVGRFELSDGLERAVADPTLAAVKAQRVGQRLIGPFGFTAVGRSFDGLHVAGDRRGMNLTVAAMRPTAGAFRVDGQPGLDVNVVYGALSRGMKHAAGEVDARLFGIWYADHRGTVPTDNRAAALRNADRAAIEVATLGGHVAGVRKAGRAKFDVLGWGAVQTGAWGALDHAAHAVALEGGLQHAAWPWAAWVRAGMLRTSGDASSLDDRHETFFQNLPTARVYARMPFFNMMNSRELFVTVQAKPTATVTLRGGVHRLGLTERSDLWYSGGGAYDSRSFGFAGRPASGADDLGRLMDLSVTWQARPRLAVELYAAAARGGDVVKGAYAGSHEARFLYLETTVTR